MKSKFSLPERKYCGGKKKMVSMRIPTELWGKIESLSGEMGWTVTDLVSTALDEFVQWKLDSRNRKKD